MGVLCCFPSHGSNVRPLGSMAGGGGVIALAIAMIGAWLLSLDVFAPLVLRERETRTGELVFAAPRILWRLRAPTGRDQAPGPV